MRYRRRILLVTLVAAALLGSGLYGTSGGEEMVLPGEKRLTQPEDTGTHLWPYTSRSRSIEGRTLAVNVIVVGDPDRTRRALQYRSATNWTVVDDENITVGNGTNVSVGDDADVSVGESRWQSARGAARYTYVSVEPNITGRWFTSEYQLGTGTYLGHRIHIRAYPAPSGNWTAIQAHAEYWDWFRLRHTVTGVEPGARYLERDLRDEPFVDDITREYHGLGGGGSDGWITVIDLVSATLAGGAVASVVPLGHRRRRDLFFDVALPVSVAGVLVSVRATGIALENAFPGVTPKLFAALLYPVIVVGPPLLTGALARELSPSRAAVLAAVGLGAGIVLDLGSVGATTVSVQFALHRVALVSALGLFALGVARKHGQTMGLGVAAWLVTLALPLFGIV